jgi:hypothetical protein
VGKIRTKGDVIEQTIWSFVPPTSFMAHTDFWRKPFSKTNDHYLPTGLAIDWQIGQ